MADKLRELIAKWRKEVAAVKGSQDQWWIGTQHCADELEAVLAESGPGQAAFEYLHKPNCPKGTDCKCGLSKLLAKLNTNYKVAQPAAAKEKVASPVEGESVVVTTVPSSYSTSNGPSYDPWAAKEKDEPIPCPTCGSIECCGLTCGPSGEPTREVPQRHELPAGHALSEEQAGTVCLKHDALPSNLTAFVTDLNALLRAEVAGSDNEISITIRGQEQVAIIMKALHDAGFVAAALRLLKVAEQAGSSSRIEIKPTDLCAKVHCGHPASEHDNDGNCTHAKCFCGQFEVAGSWRKR